MPGWQMASVESMQILPPGASNDCGRLMSNSLGTGYSGNPVAGRAASPPAPPPPAQRHSPLLEGTMAAVGAL